MSSRVPRRTHPGELASAGAAVLLLVFMFAFAWYGVDGIPGRSPLSSTENGWQALSLVRWLMLATAIAALSAPVLHATGRRYGPVSDFTAVVAALATVCGLALCYRVLVALPSPAAVLDQKLGAYLGLLSCTAIAVGAWAALQGRRTRAPRVTL